jgi:hypothetical protein
MSRYRLPSLSARKPQMRRAEEQQAILEQSVSLFIHSHLGTNGADIILIFGADAPHFRQPG